jgi:hypothetical protein
MTSVSSDTAVLIAAMTCQKRWFSALKSHAHAIAYGHLANGSKSASWRGFALQVLVVPDEPGSVLHRDFDSAHPKASVRQRYSSAARAR